MATKKALELVARNNVNTDVPANVQMSNSNSNMEPNINNLFQTMLWKNGCIIQMTMELYATKTSK